MYDVNDENKITNINSFSRKVEGLKQRSHKLFSILFNVFCPG